MNVFRWRQLPNKAKPSSWQLLLLVILLSLSTRFHLSNISSSADYEDIMVQYWRFVNIDRREKLLNNGDVSMGGILGDGMLEQLVELIKNPKWIPFSMSTTHLQVSKSNA